MGCIARMYYEGIGKAKAVSEGTFAPCCKCANLRAEFLI